MKKLHRYSKIENALKAILKFNEESSSLYRMHSFNIYRRALYRAIENCPGYIDSSVLEYCDNIINLPKSAMSEIKKLAQKALEEIEFEKRNGHDLYPCIEID